MSTQFQRKLTMEAAARPFIGFLPVRSLVPAKIARHAPQRDAGLPYRDTAKELTYCKMPTVPAAAMCETR